jgi:hypothetical protein
MGAAIPKNQLSSEPLKVLVLGVHESNAIFSAKSIMYHHSNRRFSDTADEAEIMESFGVKVLSASMLMFKG